jgi:uncharacterized membrane protein HdeD (DUF308 family)
MTTWHWHQRHARSHHEPAAAATPFWQTLALGLTTVLFGIAVLARPGGTLHLLGVLTGVWLIMLGGMRAATVFDQHAGSTRRVFAGVMAVLLVVLGISCIRNANSGTLVLAALLGLAWLLSGFAELVIAMLTTGPARIWMGVVGGLSLLVAVAFLLWPGPSLTTVVLLTGISALLIGAGEVALAIGLRRAGHDAKPLDHSRPAAS